MLIVFVPRLRTLPTIIVFFSSFASYLGEEKYDVVCSSEFEQASLTQIHVTIDFATEPTAVYVNVEGTEFFGLQTCFRQINITYFSEIGVLFCKRRLIKS